MLTRVGVVALLLLSPGIACAEPGEWIEGEVGLRRTWGRHSYTDRGHTLEGDVSGMGLSLAGRIGYARSTYWAAGVGANVVASVLDSEGFAGASIDLGLFTTVSLEARFRPLGNGFFLGPSLGYARVSFTGGKDDYGSPDNIYEFETLSGPEVALVTGWVDGHFGPAVKDWIPASFVRARSLSAAFRESVPRHPALERGVRTADLA